MNTTDTEKITVENYFVFMTINRLYNFRKTIEDSFVYFGQYPVSTFVSVRRRSQKSHLSLSFVCRHVLGYFHYKDTVSGPSELVTVPLFPTETC